MRQRFIWLCLTIGLGLGVRPPACEAVNSREFNGTTDLINFSRAAAVDDLGPLTACAWIKAAGTGENGFGRIVAKENTGAQGAGQWNFFVTTGNVFRFAKDYSGGSDLARQSGSNAFTVGSWTHGCVTWDDTAASTGINFYANGTLTNSSTSAAEGLGSQVSDAALSIIVGNRQNAERTFSGNIAYVHVFNRVLSVSEIQQLMTQPDSVTSGLVFYADLQGVSPETDGSSTGLSGTLTGTTVDTGDGPSIQEAATCLSGWTRPRTWLRFASARLR